MGVRKYNLRILPLFEEDLNDIIDYIVSSLNNPSAAESLVDRVEEAIINRLDFPESFEKYTSSKERKHPYYRIYVNHYIIFYVVIDDGVTVPIMEVRRILYNKKNIVSAL